jgi:hypothetical protein
MRYYVEKTCIDFNGRYFVAGETVDLPEGKHNAHLIPVPAEEPEAETPEAETPEPEEAVEETEEEPVEEPAPAPKKTSRKKAATTTEAEG